MPRSAIARAAQRGAQMLKDRKDAKDSPVVQAVKNLAVNGLELSDSEITVDDAVGPAEVDVLLMIKGKERRVTISFEDTTDRY